jgi:uncharacterized protein (TIGR02466 family)
MNDKMLIPLFSKPIFKTPIDIGTVDLSKVTWTKNYQNWISTDQNIIQQPEFSVVAEKVFDVICEYFYGIMQANPDAEIYITESWLNKTESGQSHHRHWHPNSILSGVVYLTGEGDTGRTKFITSQYDTIEYDINESNIYNSKSWSLPVINNTMVLFPSNVEHLVEPYTGETPRITLSFNTFIRGNLNKSPLTRLNL